MVDDHPTSLTESHISHGELLDLTEENMQYKKRDINFKDIYTIKKHLAVVSQSEHGQVEDKSITDDTVKLGVERTYHPEIREMLRRHECLWDGKTGEINITQHSIDLIPGARPFKSAPYRAGQKTRELEQF